MDPVVARRLNGERLSVLGWSRAILLQMAHPLIAAGVARHSTFRGGAGAAARRAHGTVSAMLALTFGSEEQRDSTIAHIRGIHRRVHGRLPEAAGRYPAGTVYSAEDPELLLWVHATMLESIVETYTRLVRPIASADLDTFCKESAPTLIALGGDPDRAPRDWRSLRAYMDAITAGDVLAVTADGRAVAEAVLTPRIASFPAPGASLHRLLTVGLLPPRIRTVYGFAWDTRRQKRYDSLMRMLRGLRRAAPDGLARFEAERQAMRR